MSGVAARPADRPLPGASGAWLAAVFAALWPVWSWSLARFRDGSDEPWGVVAIATLALLLWRDRDRFGGAPRAGWLLAAAAATALAVVTSPWLPPLARGVFASGAVLAALAALRRDGYPMLPQLLLALLSLPLLSSLQFYLGYPLRVVTAEASAVLLNLGGFEAVRSGSALVVDGALVIVDAPCAGIHMAWAAYFTAGVAGAWLRIAPRAFLWQLSRVGLLVLGMNSLRNTVLVGLESRPEAPAAFWHEATGLAAFAVVCALILRQMRRAAARGTD